MHDIVIAGGGLAGAAVAIELAGRGYRVVILERAAGARRKACGEGLFPAGVRALEDLGLDGVAVRGRDLGSLRFNAGGYAVEAPFRAGPALGTRREVLDGALLDHAEALDVEVRRGVTVTGLQVRDRRLAAFETTAGPVEGHVFVGADGLGSRVRKLAGLDAARVGDRYGVACHVTVGDDLPQLVDVHFRPGYEVYVTPVGAREANVAILARKPFMARFAGDPAAGYEAVLREGGVLPGGFRCEHAPRVAGPFRRGCTRAWRANLLLVGDAAGFYDGISGEGMSAALISAGACATAVDGYLRGGGYHPFRTYDRRRKAILRNAELMARVTLHLARSEAMAARAVRNLSRRPDAFEHLVAVATGEAGLRSLRPGDLGAMVWG